MSELDFLKQGYPAEVGFPSSADDRMQREFGQWDIEVEEGDEDMDVLRGLHELAAITWRNSIETINQVRNDDDPTLNAEGRLKIVGQIVEPKLTSLAKLAEREFGRVAGSIDQVKGDIRKATRTADALDTAAFDGVRQYLRSRPDDLSPHVLIARAIQARDRLTLQAVATVPPHLSGLGSDPNRVHEQAAATLAEILAPAQVKRVAILEQALGRTDHALRTLDRKINSTIDFRKARELRERAKTHG